MLADLCWPRCPGTLPYAEARDSAHLQYPLGMHEQERRMRIPVRVAVTVSVAMAALAPSGPRLRASTLPNVQVPERSPLDIAKVLAAKYPAQPIMSYIPALSWS